MSKYLDYTCSRCKASKSVSLQESLRSGKEVLPKGWAYIDIGIVAEESYILCDKCQIFYQKRIKELLRTFVTEDFNKVDR